MSIATPNRSLWTLDSARHLTLDMHEGQSRAWLSRRRFVFVLAGSQSGKTSWGPLWLYREIYGNDTRQAAGPGDYLAVTASYDLFKLKMLPALREYFEHVRGCARYWSGDRILELADPETGRFWADRADSPMWGRVILRSAASGGGLESTTARAAWLDECVAPETEVLTEVGPLPIERIVNERTRVRVWSHNERTGAWELKPIVRWQRRPQRRPLLKLNTLRLTGNHKVRTSTGYVKAGDFLPAYNGRDLDGGLSSDGCVYNLTVAGNHNYVADGILVANCGQDEFTVETWEAVLRRLSLSQGRVLGTTTPYNLGWLKTEVYDRWLAGDTNFAMIQFKSIVNPAFPYAEFERARETMPDWRFRMFYEGEFARPAGLIYDCFDQDLNTCLPFAIPGHWPRYAGLDFGGVNTALVWVAQDMDVSADQNQSVFYVYRESLEGGLTTREHVQRAQEAARGENLVGCWGGAGSEDQARRDWQNEGWGVGEPFVQDVEGGIARVYGLLKPRRLRIFKTCKGLLDEIGSYRRKLDPTGQPTEDIVDKRTYHRLDALRYFASGLFGGPGPLTADQIQTLPR